MIKSHNRITILLLITSRDIELSCNCLKFFCTARRFCSRNKAEFLYLLLFVIVVVLFVFIVACCLYIKKTTNDENCTEDLAYLRRATCAAIIRCRSTTNKQLAHVQSRHRQYFL
jgi:hypothetical protein